MFRQVLPNILAQGTGKIVVLALSLITTAVLTRSLGADGYGAYAFVTSLVLLFGAISDWGTNIITVREASQNKPLQPLIFGSTTLFRLLLAVLGIVALNLVIRVNPEWQEFIMPATVASLVLIALSLKTSFGAVFQTFLRYDFSAIVEALSSAVFLGLVLFVLFTSGDLSLIMAAWVAATFLASIGGFIFARNLSRINWSWDLRLIKRIFWQAAPAGMLFLFFNLYNRIDTVILQYFQGSQAVGIYSLAYKVHDNLVLGAAFLMNAMFPLLSSIFAQGKGSIKNYYQRSFDLLLGGGVVVFLSAFLLSPIFIRILGGEDFFLSTSVLRILLFATLISYFNHLTGYSLIAFGKQKASMLIALVALVFNIMANLAFVPLYSYTAAAVITVATEGIVLVLSTIAIKKTIDVFPSPLSFLQTWKMLISRKWKTIL